METYRILRKYFSDDHETEVIEEEVTIEEAQKHCSDPESSSRTCTLPENCARTRKRGPWFDCYTEN